MAQGLGGIFARGDVMGAAYLKARPVNYEHFPGCTGKAALASRADAVRLMRKFNRGSVYQCDFCNFWHVSSMTPTDKKRTKGARK